MILTTVLKKLIAVAAYNGWPVRFLRDWYQTHLVPIGIHAELNQKWLRKLPIRTVIDVGAHAGQFVRAIHKIFPDARIYAFEPLADCFEKLCSLKRGTPRLELFNYALGSESGPVEFHRNTFTPSSSILRMLPAHKTAFPHTATENVVRVDMVRLDDQLDRIEIVPDLLIKIDVQGYEEKVLKGGLKALQAARILIVEMSYRPLYEGQPLFDDLYRLITSHGFRYVGNLGDLKSPQDGSVIQADALFIKDGPREHPGI